MINRDTMPLPIIKEDDGEKTGVIGMTPGSGVTFICEMLEREKNFITGRRYGSDMRYSEILDLSEYESVPDLDRILVVVDCRNGRPGGLGSALSRFKGRNTACAVVFNRWREGFSVPEELLRDRSVEIIKVPEINGDMIKDLYSFVFYSR